MSFSGSHRDGRTARAKARIGMLAAVAAAALAAGSAYAAPGAQQPRQQASDAIDRQTSISQDQGDGLAPPAWHPMDVEPLYPTGAAPAAATPAYVPPGPPVDGGPLSLLPQPPAATAQAAMRESPAKAPEAKAGKAAEEASKPKPKAEPVSAEVSGPVQVYVAEKDRDLYTVLKDWAKKSGEEWTVVWQTDKTYPIAATARFEGDFHKAAAELLSAFQNVDPPIAADFWTRNKALVVSNPPATN